MSHPAGSVNPSRNSQLGIPAGNVQNGHANGNHAAPPIYSPENENPTNLTEAQMLNAAASGNANGVAAAAAAEPDIAWAFSNLKIKDTGKGFPSPETTLAHLKLLEAFYALKDEVAYTDGAFGLFDSRAPGSEESVAGDQAATIKRLEALAQIREKRWALYVARAADRFETWWTYVLTPMDKAFCQSLGPVFSTTRLQTGSVSNIADWDFFVDNHLFGNKPPKWVWTRDMLPPLGKDIMALLETCEYR